MSDHKRFWFKRRRYGWGFTPVTWQGWLLVLAFIASVVVYGRLVSPEPELGELLLYSLLLMAITLTFIFISLAKGPKPHWRWGKKDSDNPNEDW